MTSLSNGHHVIATRRGGQVEVRPNGAVARVTLANGRAATYHPHGQISTIRAPGIEINHGLRGERTIVVESNGRRVVSEGRHWGYVEHPYMERGGRAYIQRTYWEGGRSYARVYWDYNYRGVQYYQYVPTYYYHREFYGWVYNRWASPVRYRWAWWGDPWRHYYGAYFVPEPVYPSPLWWLTDYLLAQSLSAAYRAQQEAQAQAATYQPEQPVPPPEGDTTAPVELSPEIKAAIAAEVQRQLAAEQAQATQPPPPPGAPPVSTDTPPSALDPTHRLFVVSNDLTVSTADGQECVLTGGDLITRLDDTPGNDGTVRVSVLTSKPQDCGVGSTPLVAVTDLQEMQNNFHAQVDAGMGQLAQTQGKGGIPPAPDPTAVTGQVPPPAPDGNVDTQLNAVQGQAQQTEQQVQQEVQTEQAPPSQ